MSAYLGNREVSRLARIGELIAYSVRNPKLFFLTLIGVYGALWLAVTFSFPGMPFDVYEMFIFGREMQLGYWKHPPLPAWLTEIAYQLTGGWIWSHFFLAIGSILLTFYFAWRLGREMVGNAGAALAVALLIGCYYFTQPVTMYSHNVAQLPIWASTVYFYRNAVISNRTWAWIALGIVTALLLYSKYSGGLLLVVLAAHICLTKEGRVRLRSIGPWLAVLVGIALWIPNLIWLIQNDFLPFSFPFDRPPTSGLLGRARATLIFGVAQLFFHLPTFLLVAIAAARGLRFEGPPVDLELKRASRFDRSLVLSTATVPTLIIMLLTFIAGIHPRSEIGGSLVALSGLGIVLLLPEKARISAPSLATILWVGLLVGTPIGHVAKIYTRPYRMAVVPSLLFSAENLSAQMQAIWKQHTDRPLTIVTGEFEEAGRVALYTSPRASVFIDADFRKSPWITREKLRREGTLIIWKLLQFPRADELPAPYRSAIDGLRVVHGSGLVMPLGYADLKRSYGWAVVLPKQER